jgi:steroid delta-isomerase-like uncharacterized protein
MRTPDEAKGFPRRFYDEVFVRHNLKYAEEQISDSVVEHNPLAPEMGNGKAAAVATIQAILDNSPDMKAEILDMVATGDRVAVRARFTGTDNGKGWGAPMGVPATGKAFSVEGIDVVTIDDDGRFIEHYGLFDVPSMMMQLGLMPAPGGDA